MTTSRAQQIDLTATHYYHCMTRCVRRAYLCGRDKQTGKDYEHRKQWIVDRMKQLAGVFAMQICAYAVMSNHYHVVLHVDAEQAKTWDAEEIRLRWARIFPHDAKESERLPEVWKEKKIGMWRERLTNISWFMRCMNEMIARLSNAEEDCKGRFWEGRFKSQALLDDGAVLSAMAYVDLNPIRAKMAATPEESMFTSIHERLLQVARELKSTLPSPSEPFADWCDTLKQPEGLMPFRQSEVNIHPFIDFKLSDYLQLVENTGRVLREDKRGAIVEGSAPLLSRMGLTPAGWLEMVKGLEEWFSYAIGHAMVLMDFGREHRLRAPNGIKVAKRFYLKQQSAA